MNEDSMKQLASQLAKIVGEAVIKAEQSLTKQNQDKEEIQHKEITTPGNLFGFDLSSEDFDDAEDQDELDSRESEISTYEKQFKENEVWFKPDVEKLQKNSNDVGNVGNIHKDINKLSDMERMELYANGLHKIYQRAVADLEFYKCESEFWKKQYARLRGD
jgi:hypothetical protein